MSGNLAITSNASNATLTIPLSGTGGASGQLSIFPSALSFGSVAVGSSTTQPSSVSAVGNSVTISSASNSNAQFTISGISLPVTIPAGQTVGFDVIFSPTQSGTASGTLMFVSNASNSQSGESVTGAGTAVQHSVDLSWVGSTSSVAGYNVYRHEAGSAAVKLSRDQVMTPAYRDGKVAAGKSYSYAVSAVDVRGNESAPSEEAGERVP